MRVLVACEESGRVTAEFRRLGHEAYSCDILPTSGEHPEWHIQGDVLPLLAQNWDMIIAFPPCTYLSNAGAKHLFRGHKLNEERYKKGLASKEFFLAILNAPCERVAVENPVSSRVFEMPPYSQEIQPYMFGHPVRKKTRLWLRGLPPLVPTNVVKPAVGCHEAGTWFMRGGETGRQTGRKPFPALRVRWLNNGAAMNGLDSWICLRRWKMLIDILSVLIICGLLCVGLLFGVVRRL